MKMRFELTPAEMMSIRAITNLFDDEPMLKNKHEVVEELNNHCSQKITWSEDGSYKMEFEATEVFTISITNWLRDIIAQSKALIMGAVDTYKSIYKMMGVKRLVINDKEVENLTKKVRTKVHVDDMNLVITTYPLQTVSDEDEKRRVTEKVTAAIKKEVTE